MQLTEKNFDASIVNFTGPILFWASWHESSREVKKKLYPDPIKLAFDIDEAPNIPVLLGIDNIPKIIMFNNGQAERVLDLEDFKVSK